MKRFILFFLIILTQCAWDWPSGWDFGVIKPAGISYPGTVATTSVTLTVYQSGNIIVFNASNAGGQNDTAFTLPSAIPGLEYTIIADIAKYFAVTPQSADTINFSTATSGQSVNNVGSAAIGDSITLVCRTSGKWSVRNRVGTWAVGT